MLLRSYKVTIRQQEKGDPRVMVVDVVVWGEDELSHFVSILGHSGKDFTVAKDYDPFEDQRSLEPPPETQTP
jgi:hypothetical protein